MPRLGNHLKEFFDTHKIDYEGYGYIFTRNRRALLRGRKNGDRSGC
jgi:hypothetical protein